MTTNKDTTTEVETAYDWHAIHDQLRIKDIPDGSLKALEIVYAARRGSKSAENFLRGYIDWAIAQRRFNELTVSVQAIAGEIICEGGPVR